MPVESKGSKPSLPRAASGGVEDQKADEWMPQKNHEPSAHSILQSRNPSLTLLYFGIWSNI